MLAPNLNSDLLSQVEAIGRVGAEVKGGKDFRILRDIKREEEFIEVFGIVGLLGVVIFRSLSLQLSLLEAGEVLS